MAATVGGIEYEEIKGERTVVMQTVTYKRVLTTTDVLNILQDRCGVPVGLGATVKMVDDGMEVSWTQEKPKSP